MSTIANTLQIQRTVTVGRTTIPVQVTLWGEEPLVIDRNGYAKPVTIARVDSVGQQDNQHYVVNGVPVRFTSTIERTQHGLRVGYLSAYRGDKEYGLASVTDVVSRALQTALPQVVQNVLGEDEVVYDAQVARLTREVQYKIGAHQQALENLAQATEKVEQAKAALEALSKS